MTASLPVTSAKGIPAYVLIGDEVVRLLDEGLSLRAIGDRVGYSRNTVAKAAHHMGVRTDAGATEAVRGWMRQARLAQVKTLAESYELATIGRLMLMDEMTKAKPDWVAVKTLNAVWGTAADKGIELGRLLKDAQAEEHRQQAADKLMEMTQAILSQGGQDDVPLP